MWGQCNQCSGINTLTITDIYQIDWLGLSCPLMHWWSLTDNVIGCDLTNWIQQSRSTQRVRHSHTYNNVITFPTFVLRETNWAGLGLLEMTCLFCSKYSQLTLIVYLFNHPSSIWGEFSNGICLLFAFYFFTECFPNFVPLWVQSKKYLKAASLFGSYRLWIHRAKFLDN